MGFIYSQLFVRPAYPTKSFAGQTVIVTGSNTGLGLEAARHIARLSPSKLILAVRNLEAGTKAKGSIENTTSCSPSMIEVWKLDLGDSSSVQEFAARANSELERVDVLLENAGVTPASYGTCAGGHERTMTVNVISTFLLALLMLPQLKTTAKKFNTTPRLTIVSSEVHAWAEYPAAIMDGSQGVFEYFDNPKTYEQNNYYCLSKQLEILALRQLAPHLEDSGVILNTLNPGLCHSELGREGGWMLYFMKMVLARTGEVGSRTLVAAAQAGKESHGKYMTDGLVADDALSDFVRSDKGDKAGVVTWKQLKEELEGIQKGVTAGL